MNPNRCFAAAASFWIGLLALAAVSVGTGGAALGWLAPMVGFPVFQLGALMGLLALILGLVGLARTRAGSGRTGRGQALLGTLIGVGLTAIVIAGAAPGAGLPIINDVTTNPEDPPALSHASNELGEDLAYPGPAFASAQREAYPDLVSLQLPVAPEQAFERARDAVARAGLEIVASDPGRGVLEARDVSAIFRFVDDVALRVRSAPRGALVDIRSRSRDGRGDLGVNARRIRTLIAAMR